MIHGLTQDARKVLRGQLTGVFTVPVIEFVGLKGHSVFKGVGVDRWEACSAYHRCLMNCS